MSDTSVADWIIAGGTLAAAFATATAAYFAAKAATAAATEVALQRPRPILLAEFTHPFASNAPPDKHIRLRNIGTNPAFDVDVTPIETPGSVPTIGAPGRLETERIRYIQADADVDCVHRLYPERGGMALLEPASWFVNYAKAYFDEQTTSRSLPIDQRHEVPFTLSYRALDGRRFEHPYLFVIFFPKLSAWIEPVGSLLEPRTRG